MKGATLALYASSLTSFTGGAQLHLPATAADLAHALITETGELQAAARSQILASLSRLSPIDSESAAYVTALHWAQAVSGDHRPPNPIVFRSLGRDADWLAALEFVLSVLAVFDDDVSPKRRGRINLQSVRR